MKTRILLLLASLFLCSCSPSVEVGQVWEYKLYAEDPFKEPIVFKFKVIAVKDGYVQYKNINSGEVNSSDIHWFMVGSKLVSDTENKDSLTHKSD